MRRCLAGWAWQAPRFRYHRTPMRALPFALLLLVAAPASAQCPPAALGCFDDEVMFMWSDTLFDTIDLDSGWVPSSSPIQIRVGFHLAGETRIDMMGTTYAYWPTALSILPVGLTGGGRFSVDYGLEVTARIRFDVSIAGIRYTWEGDIPLPGGIPRDLRAAADASFTPFVLPGSMPRPITLTDSTATIDAFSISLGSIIGSVAGAFVDGGLTLGLRGQLDAGYVGTRTDIVRSEVPGMPRVTTAMDGVAAIVPAPGATGYGAFEDVAVEPHGIVTYTGSLVAEPVVFIEILGRRFDLARFEVPIPIVDTASEPDFAAEPIHVPLPDVAVMPDSVAFGLVMVGDRAEDTVRFSNAGEAELVIRPRMPDAPFDFATDEIRIPPRGERAFTLGFAPERDGVVSQLVAFDTNDPDRPTLTIRLSGEGDAPIVADAGPADAAVDAGRAPGVTGGACGCRVGAGASRGPLALLGLLVLVLARRRA